MIDDRHLVVALPGTGADDSLVRYAEMIAWLHGGPACHGAAAPSDFSSDEAPASPMALLTRTSNPPVVWTDWGRQVVLATPTLLRQVQLQSGHTAQQMLEVAADENTDVVLLGDGPDGAADRRLARRLARAAACSVWLVPAGSRTRLRRILVPVDFSPRDANTLRVATTLARLSGLAECLALHVYFDDCLVSAPGRYGALREELGAAFTRFLAPIDCLGVKVTPLLREGADVGRAVLRGAEEEEDDLVVMASRGRTTAAPLLRESVAEKTLRQTRVPLLVVKNFGTRIGAFRVLRELLGRRGGNLRFN